MNSAGPVAVFALLGCVAAIGCAKDQPSGAKPAGSVPSPNASILPAPLASGPPRKPVKLPANGKVGVPVNSAGRLVVPKEEVRPTPLRPEVAPPSDDMPAKPMAGVSMTARFVWPGQGTPKSGDKVDVASITTIQKRLEANVRIELASAGRLRLVMTSAVFPLPLNSEIRARSDRFGHIVVWPNRRAYRVVPVGGLRALFAERRADVMPDVAGKVLQGGKGKHLTMATQDVSVSTSTGKATLTQAKVVAAGAGGELLCRMLLELVAARPNSAACAADLVPLKAPFTWPGNKVGLEFEATQIAGRQDLASGGLRVPPRAALFKPSELPPQPTGVLISKNDATAFRSGVVANLPSPEDDAPGEGLSLKNNTDTLRYLLIDSVPVTWVAPQSEVSVIGFQRGKYRAQWRDFLGQTIGKPKTITMPATLTIGPAAKTESDQK